MLQMWSDGKGPVMGAEVVPEVVVVYEPRRLVREGMAAFLEREGFAVDTCATSDEMLRALRSGIGGLAVVSFDSAPVETSAALAGAGAQLRRFRVLALASVLDQVTARRLRAFGVHEIASPDIGLDGLADLLRAPAPPAARAAGRGEQVAGSTLPHLTAREREVLALVSAGLTANQIASELHISSKTVENHKQRVFRKLDVQSQSHAVSVAMRLGLLNTARTSAYAAGS